LPINSITAKVLQSNVCLPLSPAKGDIFIMNLTLVTFPPPPPPPPPPPRYPAACQALWTGVVESLYPW
jgi:hypothetical protein